MNERLNFQLPPTGARLAALLTLVALPPEPALGAEPCLPGDSSVTCCLKVHPELPERCTGSAAPEAAPANAPRASAAQAPQRVPHRVPWPEQEQALLALLEKVLVECARLADKEVNALEQRQWQRQGREPQWREGEPPPSSLCEQTYRQGSRNRVITWAMHLGTRKHEHARLCVRDRLPADLQERVLLETRYRWNERTQAWERLSKQEEQRLISEQRWDELEGTAVPDVVFLAKDLLMALAGYDLKFPCPEDNVATWTLYRRNHPWEGRSQRDLYKHVLNVLEDMLRLVSPREGVIR